MSKKNPAYEVYLPIWNQTEPWFYFAEGQRQTFVGGNPWRLSPIDKKEPVHAQASSCNAVVNVYKNAIAVGGPAGTGEMIFISSFMILVCGVVVVMSGMLLEVTGFDLFSVIPLFLLVSSFYCLSFFTRLSFFKVRDMPVLFNRQSRLVSISKPRPLSFLKFWQAGTIEKVVTYSWDCIHVRSYKYMQMMGETSREAYNLTLLCTDPNSPRSFKDSAYLGHVESWEDATLWRLWEHIRRYMEEDGPPLQSDETLRTSGTGKLPKFPQHLIDAAGGEALSIQEIEQLTGFDHRLW